MRFKKLLSAVICTLLIATTAWVQPAYTYDLELSGHARSTRNGRDAKWVPGARLRYKWVEGTVEYNINNGNILGSFGPTWILNERGTFRPYVYLGLGFNFSIALVPAVGFRLQWGRFAFRLDTYWYVVSTEAIIDRYQTYGISWSF